MSWYLLVVEGVARRLIHLEQEKNLHITVFLIPVQFIK